MTIMLSQIEPPELIAFDRSQYISEMVSRLQQHPDWDENYNGLLFHDATTMMMYLYAFVAEKNAESFDRKLREVWLDSCLSERATVNTLNEMNIVLQQNTESVVMLEGVFQNIYVTQPFTIPNDTLILANGLDSQTTAFEIIKKDENGDYDYFNDVEINPGQNLKSFYVAAYSGQSFRYVFELDMTTKENFQITVPYRPIIQDSIQVYFYLNGAYFRLTEDTLEGTGKIITGVFPDGAPKYNIKYTYDNKAVIYFGSQNFGGAFTDAHMLGSVVVYGRYGGGEATNIPAYTLDQIVEVDIGIGDYTNIRFRNIEDAGGGSDAEDISVAKVYAPMRRGRGKQIVDKVDAETALMNRVVKHEIESPTYAFEQTNSVPLLHQFHYIVPLRDFATFTWPDVDPDDDTESYSELFVDTLTNFLNVKGTHASAVSNELVTEFTYYGNTYNILTALKSKYIFSDTLYLTAYNENDEAIDKIVFEGNYPITNTIFNKYEYTRAIVYSKSFADVTVTVTSDPSGRSNNKFMIKYDDEEYDFAITLSAGTYSASVLAQALQDKIIELIETDFDPAIIGRTSNFWVVRNTHKFVEFDTETEVIQFISPKYSKESKVKITGNSGTAEANLCEDLGITPGTYRATRSNLVFNGEASYFKYDTSDMFISIETGDMNHEEDFTVDPSQDPSSSQGPIVNLTLYDYVLEHNQMFQSGTTITVEAWGSGTRKDSVQFKNITPYVDELKGSGGTNWTGAVFQDSGSNIFTYSTANLQLQLKNPTSTQTAYSQSFDPITKIDIYKDDGGTQTFIATFTSQPSWEQEPNQEEGPTIYLYPLTLTIGDKYLAKIFTNDGTGEVIGDTVVFTSIEDYQTQGYGEVLAPNNIASDDTVNRPCIYDKYRNKMTICCKDGEIDLSAPEVYFAAFADIDTIKVFLTRKNYSYITASYTPNPYHPEYEAKIYMDILNRKDLRLIGLENQLKDINFIPIGLTINLNIKNTHSSVNARYAVYDEIINNYGYENYNPKHVLNKVFDATDLSYIITPLMYDYGIESFSIVEGSLKYFGEVESGKKGYYFFLDEDTIQTLKALEDEYAQLEGLADNFRLTINTTFVES